MADFVPDASLLADCRDCCVADAAAGPRAASAVLEYCATRLRAFPHVNTFVDKEIQAYGGAVSTRQRYGWPPRLVLLDAAGAPLGDPVAVDHFKTEAIVEFLAARGLTKEKGEGAAAAA